MTNSHPAPPRGLVGHPTAPRGLEGAAAFGGLSGPTNQRGAAVVDELQASAARPDEDVARCHVEVGDTARMAMSDGLRELRGDWSRVSLGESVMGRVQ